MGQDDRTIPAFLQAAKGGFFADRYPARPQKDTIIIPYSSLSKQGREEIYDLLDSILSEDGGIKACGDNPENM